MHSTEAKHQKHGKLTRPQWGNYGRFEVALLGAPCDSLRAFARQLGEVLGEDHKVAWLDAYHPDEEETKVKQFVLNSNNIAEYKIRENAAEFDIRKDLEEYDIVLLNGNHFKGSRQIIFLDPGKKESLSRKLDRLTNPISYVSTEDRQAPYSFLAGLKGLAGTEIPVHSITDIKSITNIVANIYSRESSTIKALILAGGRSERMGRDKSRICYHGQEQYARLADILDDLADEVYISCRPEQAAYFENLGYQTLADKFSGLGPYGAILSAFQADPDAAWLVTACDLPFLNKASFESLMDGRNRQKVATAFYNAATSFPDPLITIWEPKSYSRLLWFMAQGHSCPRKVLINSDIHTLQPQDENWLRNINTPEDLASAITELNGG